MVSLDICHRPEKEGGFDEDDLVHRNVLASQLLFVFCLWQFLGSYPFHIWRVIVDFAALLHSLLFLFLGAYICVCVTVYDNYMVRDTIFLFSINNQFSLFSNIFLDGTYVFICKFGFDPFAIIWIRAQNVISFIDL